MESWSRSRVNYTRAYAISWSVCRRGRTISKVQRQAHQSKQSIVSERYTYALYGTRTSCNMFSLLLYALVSIEDHLESIKDDITTRFLPFHCQLPSSCDRCVGNAAFDFMKSSMTSHTISPNVRHLVLYVSVQARLLIGTCKTMRTHTLQLLEDQSTNATSTSID